MQPDQGQRLDRPQARTASRIRFLDSSRRGQPPRINVVRHVGFHLVTMSSQQFRRFVAATGQASAVQSRRYQQLDSLLYGLHPAKKEAIGLFPELADIRPGPALTLDRLLRRHLGDRGFEPVVVAAQSLDTALYRWRARHFGASNRLYPYTGLELGSEYLGSHYSHRLSAVSHLQERPGHR